MVGDFFFRKENYFHMKILGDFWGRFFRKENFFPRGLFWEVFSFFFFTHDGSRRRNKSSALHAEEKEETVSKKA